MKLDHFRDHFAFWIFGMANSFAFCVMLTAAQDIMTQNKGSISDSSTQQTELGCEKSIDNKACSTNPLGIVLLFNIVPAFVVKMTVPFFMHKLPFSILHILVVLFQGLSYILVAFATSINTSLLGVGFAALSSGLGDICYLALSSHYNKATISFWASGSGASGILGSITYAILTEPRLTNLSPQYAILTMMIVPLILLLTYFLILTPALTVYRPRLLNPLTWIVPKTEQRRLSHKSESKNNIYCIENDIEKSHKLTIRQKLQIIYKLKKFIIPLTIVYYADYASNQGIIEFIAFDCEHGFGLSRESQYRWFQVIYFFGGLVARTTANLVSFPYFFLILFPLYELGNGALFFFQSIHSFIDHISIIFILVFVEGLVGGAAYAKTYFLIHKEVDPSIKEFALAATTMSDVIGIGLAGLSTLPLHQIVCNLKSRSITS